MSEKARKAEAADGLAKVEWRGHTFTVSTEYDEWSIDFLESLEDGKTVGIIRGALGASQWREVQRMNLKVRDLADLATAVASAMGFGSPGESPASSD